MPELPEVETVKRGLNEMIVGKTIIAESHDYQVNFPNKALTVKRFLIGARVLEIRRKGKLLIIDFDTDYSLMIHLRMTGQLIYLADDSANPLNLPNKATRVIFEFKDGGRLFFNDQRRFGYAILIPSSEVEQTKFVQKLGPEPLEKSFTAKLLKERLRNRKAAIKTLLLNQQIIAGIGNIYADESLILAKIHPETAAYCLTDRELKRLTKAIKTVLQTSIDLGGSTSKDYLTAEGKRGEYLDNAYAYKREGQPCLVCGSTIQKIRVAGRGTHFCPKCQKYKE